MGLVMQLSISIWLTNEEGSNVNSASTIRR